MPSLKSLKTRITSVKSTQKITKAMKMVAAAKLRRAKEQAEASRPYAERMERIVQNLASRIADPANAPPLLAGRGKSDVHLLIVATADRGLCGGFNGSIVRAARRKILDLKSQGKQVKLLIVGRKGYDMLVDHRPLVVDKILDVTKRRIQFETADEISQKLRALYDAGEFDVATIIYNHFKSAITQVVTFQQLIPLSVEKKEPTVEAAIPYEYEPEEDEILGELLPKNVSIQLFKALLENAASEQGARMSAMDNATRNAGEMIKKLTLSYNRSRQAAITKELIEIISGAEAL